jgi:hypothetical protein
MAGALGAPEKQKKHMSKKESKSNAAITMQWGYQLQNIETVGISIHENFFLAQLARLEHILPRVIE